jgi:hypothetical protein
MALLFLFYRLIIWIPAAVSEFLLILLWEDLDRPPLYLVWFGVALLLEIASRSFSPLWWAGFLSQIVPALCLYIRRKMLEMDIAHCELLSSP